MVRLSTMTASAVAGGKVTRSSNRVATTLLASITDKWLPIITHRAWRLIARRVHTPAR